MGDVNVSGKLTIKDVESIAPIKIAEVKSIDPIRITEVSNIAPVAAHIKEVNHIDPISVDALHVSEVKNIEPIRIEKFNITNLPMVNVALRQLPSVDMNVRRLPPVSVGTHQHFRIPSNYTVRIRFLGVEFFRVHMNGHTRILPRERSRREQGRTQNRSFPVTAAAGNPAIPSRCHEKSVKVRYSTPHYRSGPPNSIGYNAMSTPEETFQKRKSRRGRTSMKTQRTVTTGTKNPLHSGHPLISFRLPETKLPKTYGGSSVSSGR